MAISFANVDAVLANTAGVLVTGPSSGGLMFSQATLTNTDASAHTVTLYRTAGGAAAATANIIAMDAVSIAAGQTIAAPIVGVVLYNGGQLQGVCDTGAVVNFSATWAYAV